MTDFHVEIVQVTNVQKHPNADTLDTLQVHDGYTCIVRSGSFKDGDVAVYVPIDSMLPDVEEFAFLDASSKRRLKAKKLRGIFSMGLIVPVPSRLGTVNLGDDVAEALGIRKFEPSEAGSRAMGGECEKAPEGWEFVRYTDIEPLRRNGNVLVDGEDVVITEKIHGANYRACHDGTRLWIGSQTQIKKPLDTVEESSPIWWRIAERERLAEKLSKRPNVIVFGEVFGPGVQDLSYGMKKQTLRAFDAFDTKTMRYLDHHEFVNLTDELNIERVPLLYEGRWHEGLKSLCEGSSVQMTLNDAASNAHVREGFVVKPVKERWDHRVGRVILKHCGEGYYLRKGG